MFALFARPTACMEFPMTSTPMTSPLSAAPKNRSPLPYCQDRSNNYNALHELIKARLVHSLLSLFSNVHQCHPTTVFLNIALSAVVFPVPMPPIIRSPATVSNLAIHTSFMPELTNAHPRLEVSIWTAHHKVLNLARYLPSSSCLMVEIQE